MPKWASLTENNLSQTSAFWFFSYQRNRKSTAKVKKVAIGFEKFSFLPETKPFEAEFCQKKISSTFVAQKKNAVDVDSGFGSVFLRRRRRRRLLLSGGTTQVHALQRESQRRSHR